MTSASARSHVRNEAFHDGTAQLKQEGKLRYVGISCHGTNWTDEEADSMEAVLGTAIEDGRFDVMLLVYNYLRRQMGERLLRECREKNIGATLMKTSPFGHGGFTYFNDIYAEREQQGEEAPEWIKTLRLKYERQREQARPFLEQHNLTTPDQIRDAAIRFVLDNPDVHSALVTFKNFDDVDNYLPLSGSRFTETDESSLNAYAETSGQLYCRHACGICESQCPSRVPVNTIMRYNNYFVGQGREKWALELYRDLEGQKADLCGDCEGHCQSACPFGVPIHDLLNFAHSNLTVT
jgi:predicted aldo/keto reductase-like oxidoreductase